MGIFLKNWAKLAIIPELTKKSREKVHFWVPLAQFLIGTVLTAFSVGCGNETDIWIEDFIDLLMKQSYELRQLRPDIVYTFFSQEEDGVVERMLDEEQGRADRQVLSVVFR